MAAEVLLNTELSLCLYKAISEKDYKRVVFLYADIARKAVLCNSRWTTARRQSITSEEKVDEFYGKGVAPYNLMVMEELDSIMEMALGGKMDKQIQEMNWQQAPRRSRKNVSYTNVTVLPFQEEEVSMRSAAKVLSNTRAPPSFVLYPSEEHEETTTPLFDGSAAGSGGTLLHLACIVDAPLALALLLAMGGDPTGRHSAFRRLPVHETCCSDSEECLALLLHLAQTSQNVKVQDTKVAAHCYDFDGRSFTQTLRLFLDLCDDLSELDAAKTLLSQVTLPDSTRSALLSCSPTSSTPDGHGNTPLHWASFKNAKSCVNLLLQHGADPNAKAHPSGWTPLHDASYSNASASLSLLLEAGAYVDARASSGATPLCFAAQEDAPDSAQLLLNAGASTTIRCCGNVALLHGAIQQNQPSSRFSGYTPLHYCAHYNASNAARLILLHNADNIMHIPDLSNKLPIHVAVIRGSDAVLKLLFSHGAALPPSLNQHIPKKPIQSTKPWNCLTQERISKCSHLLQEASREWDMSRHYLYSPIDKSSIRTILLISKRMEQYHYGIYLKEVWLEILTFTGRGWFETNRKERHSPFMTQYRTVRTDIFNDMIDYDLDEEEQDEESDDEGYPYLAG